MTEDESYAIAYAVLIGLVLFAVLPFAILSLTKNRSLHDPARKFVPWLKASFVLFSIAMALLFAESIINNITIRQRRPDVDTIRAVIHISYLDELFRTFSAATVMVLLLELGPGFHYAIEGVSRQFDKVIRYTAYFLAFVVVSLAIAYYGLVVDLQVHYTNFLGAINRGGGLNRLTAINKLFTAYSIILWVASLATTSLSIYVFVEKKTSPLRSASMLHLVASILNLLGSTWNFAYVIHWILEIPRQIYQPYYVTILSIILAWWSRGAALVIAYFVAARQRNMGGVWTVQKNDSHNAY